MKTNRIIRRLIQTYCSIVLLTSLLSHTTDVSAQVGFCTGDSVFLDAGTNFTGSVQWQQSNNGTSFTDIPGATTNPYKMYPLTTKYYRARIVNNSCLPEYSDTVYMTVSLPGQFLQTDHTQFSTNTSTGLDTSGNQVTLIATGTLSFGTGANGAFSTSGDTSIAGGTYNFTSFTIGAGDSCFVTGTNPLIIYSTSGVTINGVLTLSGGNGGNGNNGVPPGLGGTAGGGGGYAGGIGGTGGAVTQVNYHGLDGSGPGPVKGGITEYVTSLDGQGGGGGGYDTTGGNSIHSGGGGGIGGAQYGSAMLTVLQGGSGGGGGAGDDDTPGISTDDDGGGGGGGGGGAVKIVSSSISVGSAGKILSEGGKGGSCGNGGSGGGGSGGSIHLSTYTLTNQGTISAKGGVSTTNQLANSAGGTGSDGRIRFDRIIYSNTGTVTPAPGYTSISGVFNTSGNMTTNVISVPNLCKWGLLTYSVDVSGTGVSLQVDVLNASGSVIAANVASGVDLSTLPAVAALNALKLKLSMATSNISYSPVLKDWKVAYFTK